MEVTKLQKQSGRSRRRVRADGEGTIYKRKDGIWEGKFIVGYDQNGKRIRRSVYGKTQGRVRERMEKLKADYQAGTHAKEDPGNMSLGQFLHRWLAAQDIGFATRSSYKNAIDTHIIPRIGMFGLKELKVAHVIDLFEGIKVAFGYNSDKARPKGARTLSNVHFVLRKALAAAAREYKLDNPMTSELVPRFSQTYSEAECMTPDEVHDFTRALDGERLGPLFVLALHTGCRPGELLGLAWSDIDWKRKTLTIRRSIGEVEGILVLTAGKNFTSRRTITLPDAAIDVLRQQRAWQQQEFEKYCQGDCDNPKWFHTHKWVFTNTVGHPLRRGNVQGKGRALRRILQRANIERRVTMHTFRHTHASLLLLQKVPVNCYSQR